MLRHQLKCALAKRNTGSRPGLPPLTCARVIEKYHSRMLTMRKRTLPTNQCCRYNHVWVVNIPNDSISGGNPACQSMVVPLTHLYSHGLLDCR